MIITFGDSVALFASSRINNLMISIESSTRVEAINATTLEVIGRVSKNERPHFDQVLEMYSGSFDEQILH